MIYSLLLCIDCFIIKLYAIFRECNKFDTGIAEPKLENVWPNSFVILLQLKTWYK